MVMNSADARKRIESYNDLPTLPSVATEIIRLANSPKTNAADVGHIIQQDQALTTKVLKLVNSAFYGFPGQIKTIQHAVVIIGFNKVKNVVTAASLFDMTKGREKKNFDIPKFWLYSLGAAISARSSIKVLNSSQQPEDAFVAGLIHSIGVLILDQVFTSEYEMVLDYSCHNKVPLVQAEKELLGFTHCQAGEWVAEKWQLPMVLRQAVRFYSRPLMAREEEDIVCAVHLGSALSRALGIGSPGDPFMFELDAGLKEKYSVSIDMLDGIMSEVLSELRLAKEFIDLIED